MNSQQLIEGLNAIQKPTAAVYFNDELIEAKAMDFDYSPETNCIHIRTTKFEAELEAELADDQLDFVDDQLDFKLPTI